MPRKSLLSLEKLSKFIQLERSRNYDNKAIFGGLSKIVPVWEKEAQEELLESNTIQTIVQLITEYEKADLKRREGIIQNIFTEIQSTVSHHKSSDDSLPVENQQKITTKDHRYIPKLSKEDAVGLNAPLTVLTGVGQKNAERLARLNLSTLGDLLHYYPRRYDDYSQLKTINQLKNGDETTVIGIIQNIQTRQTRNRRMKITEAILSDSTGFLRITWFNQPWLEKSIRPRVQIVVSGKIDMYLGRLVMNSPEWESLDKEQLNTNRIVPVYALTAKITQRWLRQTIFKVLRYWVDKIFDFLPTSIRQEANLMNLSTAYQQIHFPDTTENLEKARYRLAFDEIFILQMGLMRQKKQWLSQIAESYPTTDTWLEQQLNSLPFQLTNSQLSAINSIREDITMGHPMNRLLQGDVGSGKTVVAAMAIAMICEHNKQAAIMAPTSILAEQHFQSLSTILTKGEHPPLKEEEIALLIGDTSTVEKKRIREQLRNNSLKLVIGTHALIEDPVQFNALQMIIIDEQHRFGVQQRALLRQKGENPHLLVMTATPIPRSMALTVYGDLDISVMDEMPPGRKPVRTHVVSPVDRERVYQFIDKQITLGNQAFIIYPLVEQGDNEQSKAAVEEQTRLQNEIFPNLKLGLLHGRLKPVEKEEVMRKFRNKEFNILVSTSVIEVGVDIPNATVMVIDGANRFGLAQLHQLRGRVGRDNQQAYCFLIPETFDALENERLQAMVSTNDGFILADLDLKQRGPGDFLGTRQSGYSGLRLANLTDVKLIETARKHAKILFETDPELIQEENLILKDTINQWWDEGEGDIS